MVVWKEEQGADVRKSAAAMAAEDLEPDDEECCHIPIR